MIRIEGGWSEIFPQAFSHISLVNTAHNLSHSEKPSDQRSGRNSNK